MKASDHLDGIETLFNEALAQLRHGLNPRASNLAAINEEPENKSASPQAIRIPNRFGSYNIFANGKIKAVAIPEQFTKSTNDALNQVVAPDSTTM